MRHRFITALLVFGLFFFNVNVYAGQQAEERLADSVRVLLRQSVSAELPDVRPFTSHEDAMRFYRWRAIMSERIFAHVPSAYQREIMLNAVDYESRRAGLDPALVLGVIDVESRFNTIATSRVGARGLMQVMPFWSKTIGDGNAKSLYRMRINVRFGCVILRHYLDQEHGSVVRALARYNGSLGQTNYAYSVLRASLKYR